MLIKLLKRQKVKLTGSIILLSFDFAILPILKGGSAASQCNLVGNGENYLQCILCVLLHKRFRKFWEKVWCTRSYANTNNFATHRVLLNRQFYQLFGNTRFLAKLLIQVTRVITYSMGDIKTVRYNLRTLYL